MLARCSRRPRDRNDVALALQRQHHPQLLICGDTRADDFWRIERELNLGIRFRLRSRSSSADTSASRDTARASPVTVALFTRTLNASISRQSAGTLSPALNRITSPGTTSSDGITVTTPSRCALT
jgi:hypothetical protein